jgi:hypothetical protein
MVYVVGQRVHFPLQTWQPTEVVQLSAWKLKGAVVAVHPWGCRAALPRCLQVPVVPSWAVET